MNTRTSARHSSLSDPGWGEGIIQSSARQPLPSQSGPDDEHNPYSAPSAPLYQRGLEDETYKPSIFALKGRIGCLRYLAYSFISSLVLCIPIGILAALVIPSLLGRGSVMTTMIFAALMYVPVVAMMVILAVRRLNDLEHTGWLSLLFLIPLVNVLLGLYLTFGPGTAGSNQYGPKPEKNSWPLVVFGLAFPLLGIIGMGFSSMSAYKDYTNRAKAAQARQSAQP